MAGSSSTIRNKEARIGENREEHVLNIEKRLKKTAAFLAL